MTNSARARAPSALSLEQLAERIAEIESRLSPVDGLAPEDEPSEEALSRAAMAIYRARRRRRRYFKVAIFADPAWDMLIELFVARVRGTRITTKSLSLAAEVPETTGLRWIGVLEKHGLIERHRSVDDARVRLIELTPHGTGMMRQYLADGLRARFLAKL